MSLSATTAQTVGPFFRIGFERLYEIALAPEGVGGERMTIIGRVLDGDGVGVPDAVLELWQANAEGKYAYAEDTQDKAVGQHFTGFGRVPTDAQGRFCFSTIKPGRVPDPDGKRRTLSFRFSCVDFSGGSSRVSTSRMSRPTR